MQTTDGRKNLFDVVDDFDVAMLVTHTANAVHARPMAIARLDYGLDVYLVTDIHSLKIDEIGANANALLTFQSSKRFASVYGQVTVMSDRALIGQLWKEGWKVWFPEGKSDPAIAVLRFAADKGEFWDNAGVQGLKYVFQAAKAYVTGETPRKDEAQHARIRL